MASTDEHEDASEDKRSDPKKKGNKLDMVRWISAFQSYALAADACEAWFLHLCEGCALRARALLAGMVLLACNGASGHLSGDCGRCCNRDTEATLLVGRHI